MICTTCNGRGWVKDGTSHGGLCMDCAAPEVMRAITSVKRAPARTPKAQDANHEKPRRAVKAQARKRTLTQADARVESAASERPFAQVSCKAEGCNHFIYRYGHCKGHYFAICRAKKRESLSSLRRSE